MPLNITNEPLWRVRDTTSRKDYLSLPEILLRDDIVGHAPLYGGLLNMQHELLSSVLQVAVDRTWTKGLDQNQYHLLLNAAYQNVRPLLKMICVTLSTSMPEFHLYGPGAFLQMPAAWRGEGMPLPISNLMYPFIPMRHGASKGLRRMESPPQQIDAGLAALLLFSHSMLARSGVQYWTSGIFANKTVGHILTDQKSLRQQLFAAVLPGFASTWKPLQRMPWYTDCQNNAGLDFNDCSPLANYIAHKRINGTGTFRFFLSRAMLLGHPENTRCSITGRNTKVYVDWEIFSEPKIHKLLEAEGKQKNKLPKKASGIMQNMYSSDVLHPSVCYKQQQSGDKILPVLPNLRPQTSDLQRINKCNTAAYALAKKSYSATTGGKNKKSCLLPMSFFQFTYKPQKQAVSGVHQTTFDFSEWEETQIECLAKETSSAIYRYRKGLSILAKEKDLYSNKFEVIFTNLQNQINLEIKRSYQHTGSDQADMTVWKTKMSARIKQLINREWGKTLVDYLGMPKSMTERSNIYHATIKATVDLNTDHEREDFGQEPSVRAGRAFAESFTNLTQTNRKKILDGLSPSLSAAFWVCVKSARREKSNIYIPLYEKAINLLRYCEPDDSNKNIGSVLGQYVELIHPSRIENIFSETDQFMLIEELSQALSIIKSKIRKSPEIDFGVALKDLCELHFQPIKILGKWCEAFYSQQDDSKKGLNL